jgi:hypothetical protein
MSACGRRWPGLGGNGELGRVGEVATVPVHGGGGDIVSAGWFGHARNCKSGSHACGTSHLTAKVSGNLFEYQAIAKGRWVMLDMGCTSHLTSRYQAQ